MAATGMPAKASRKAGGSSAAFGGHIFGRNLVIVPGKMIVQSWRARQWKPEDPDSILVVRFTKAPGGGRIDLIHVNVPQYDHKGLTQGRRKYYGKPWKAYLAAR
jgi:uncharacterized protein YndB with AHSA1/START domain